MPSINSIQSPVALKNSQCTTSDSKISTPKNEDIQLYQNRNKTQKKDENSISLRKIELHLNLSTVDKFLYGDEIQAVVDKNKIVLAIRAPNEHSVGLLKEGYASKNFHIKAKSSTGGPTAGFVVTDPMLSKVRGQGTAAIAKQQKTVNEAQQKGAKAIQIELSDHRIEYLISNNLIETVSSTANTKIIRGHYGDNSQEYFRLTKTTSGAWQLAHLKDYQSLANLGNSIPVMGLTNPPAPGAVNPSGAKSIVTADYDLFGVWPKSNFSNNSRQINTVPRPLQGKVANFYISKLKGNSPTDKDMGNISFFVKKIITQLNSEVKQSGYQGGFLFHHGEETANPYSSGQDYPIILFIPEKSKPYRITSDQEQKEANLYLTNNGYDVEINPSFSYPNYYIKP